MKLQVDTTAKTIKLEESIKLDTLFNTLNEMLPNNGQREFELLTNVTVEWKNVPILIQPSYPYRYPWYQPYYRDTGDYTTPEYKLTRGIFDIEINY